MGAWRPAENTGPSERPGLCSRGWAGSGRDPRVPGNVLRGMHCADRDLLRAVVSPRVATMPPPSRQPRGRNTGRQPASHGRSEPGPQGPCSPQQEGLARGKGDQRQPGLTSEGRPGFHPGSGTLSLHHVPCTYLASVYGRRGLDAGTPRPLGLESPCLLPTCPRSAEPSALVPLPPARSSNTGLPNTANTRKAHQRRTFARLPLLYYLFQDLKSGHGFFFFLTRYLEEREQHEWEAFSSRQR